MTSCIKCIIYTSFNPHIFAICKDNLFKFSVIEHCMRRKIITAVHCLNLLVEVGLFTPPPPPLPFHWTAMPLRSWRSRFFSKLIPNRRGSVDNHTISGLDASSTLPRRFYYASVTLLLRSALRQ